MKPRFRWLLLLLGLCSAPSWAHGGPPRDGLISIEMNRASLRQDIVRFNADRAQGRSGWGAPPGNERGERQMPQQERGGGRGGRHRGPRG